MSEIAMCREGAAEVAEDDASEQLASESVPVEGDAAVSSAPALSGAVPSASAVVIGVLAGLGGDGRPLVAFADNPSELPIAAKTVVAVSAEFVGREVALLFEDGDIGRPILIGIVQVAGGAMRDGRDEPVRRAGGDDSGRLRPAGPEEPELFVDGERVAIRARDALELRCGKASVTLTRAGKVIIRGAYVSTRSSGVNRIKGGSVQIN